MMIATSRSWKENMDLFDFRIIDVNDTGGKSNNRPYKVFDERGSDSILVASTRTLGQAQNIIAIRQRMAA